MYFTALFVIIPLIATLLSIVRRKEVVIKEYYNSYEQNKMSIEEREEWVKKDIEKTMSENKRCKLGKTSYGRQKIYKMKWYFKLDSYDINVPFVISTIFLSIGILIFVVGGIMKVGHESEYYQKENEYKILTAQLERIESGEFQENYIINGEIGSLSSVYDDIKEYNNWVIRNQYWNDNPWFSFFYNKYADNLVLIELE